MRWLASTVFALAVTGSTLAGSGLVVAPHVDPPGTPRFHEHVLAAYRFPLFAIRMTDRLMTGPRFGQLAPTAELTFVVLALLVAFVPRLPRPTRRVLARLEPPPERRSQWRPDAALAPPRAATLLAVTA